MQRAETAVDTQAKFDVVPKQISDQPTRDVGGEEVESSSSSSSLTLKGTVSAPAQKPTWSSADESSRLLAKPLHGITSAPKRTIYSYIRGWLMYQPRPIPVVGKALPSNATSIAVISFIALNTFYSLYKIPFTMPTLFIFADRAALMFVVNLPLLYLLGAKNQPIKMLTGHSYESLNMIHRRLGEVMCLLALLHSGGMIGVWYELLRPVGLSFARFALSKIILLGIGAFVAYEAIYLTSLASFRQRWYELFLGLHVLLQSAALVLLWFHHHNSRVYVVVALGIWTIDRMVCRYGLKTRQLKATLEVMRDGHTVSLRARIPVDHNKSRLSRLLMVDIAASWQPTQHTFLSIPILAPKHLVQAHPFTIVSSSPLLASEAEVRLIIRAQDGFSKDLLAYAKNHKQVKVRLDGPYGSQTALETLADSDLAVVVAGGSGIAVAWPLVRSIQGEPLIEEVDLECFSKRRVRKVLLVWIVHQQSHVSWIGESNLKALSANGVDVIVPAPTAECGRPDVGAIVKNWIEEHDRASKDVGKHVKTGVVCSGPEGMNRAVRNTCAAMAADGRNVNVEIEKFGW